MSSNSPSHRRDPLRLVLSCQEQILSLQRNVETARGDLTLSSADVAKLEIAAVLEATFLRQTHDALTAPMVRALIRTGIWSPEDLVAFLVGSVNTGNAAVIMADCCDLLPAHCLGRMLDFLLDEKQQDSAAYSVKRFVPACLDAECHNLAVLATNWYARQFAPHIPGSELDWVILTVRLYEKAGRPASRQELLGTIQSSQVLTLFDAWCSRLAGMPRVPTSRSSHLRDQSTGDDGASLTAYILKGDYGGRTDPVFDWMRRFAESDDAVLASRLAERPNGVVALVKDWFAPAAATLNPQETTPSMITAAEATNASSGPKVVDAEIRDAMSMEQYGVWRFDYVHGQLRDRAGALSKLCEGLDGSTLTNALARFLACRWTDREGYEFVTLLRDKRIREPELIALAFDVSVYSAGFRIADLLSLVSTDEALSRLASGNIAERSSAIGHFALHGALDGWSASDLERLENLILEHCDAHGKAGYALRRRIADDEPLWAGHILAYLRTAVSSHGSLLAPRGLIESATARLSGRQVEDLIDGLDSVPLVAQGELLAILAESERPDARLTELVRKAVIARVAMPENFRYQRWGTRAINWITDEISLLRDLDESDFIDLLAAITQSPICASNSAFLDLVASRIVDAKSKLDVLSAAFELPGVMDGLDPESTLMSVLGESMDGQSGKSIDALCSRIDLGAAERLLELERNRNSKQSTRRRRQWNYCAALKARWAVLMIESGLSARMFDTLESEWTGRASSARESGYATDVMREIAAVLEMSDVERFLNLYKRAYRSYRIVSTPWALVTLIVRATESGVEPRMALNWIDFIVESQKGDVIRLIVQTTKEPIIGAAWRALLALEPDFSQMKNRELGNSSAGDLAYLAPQLETVDAHTWSGLWRETIDRLMEFDHQSASLVLLGLANPIHDRYGMDVLRYMYQKMNAYRRSA